MHALEAASRRLYFSNSCTAFYVIMTLVNVALLAWVRSPPPLPAGIPARYTFASPVPLLPPTGLRGSSAVRHRIPSCLVFAHCRSRPSPPHPCVLPACPCPPSCFLPHSPQRRPHLLPPSRSLHHRHVHTRDHHSHHCHAQGARPLLTLRPLHAASRLTPALPPAAEILGGGVKYLRFLSELAVCDVIRPLHERLHLPGRGASLCVCHALAHLYA